MTFSYIIILIRFISPLPSFVPFCFSEFPFSSQPVTHLPSYLCLPTQWVLSVSRSMGEGLHREGVGVCLQCRVHRSHASPTKENASSHPWLSLYKSVGESWGPRSPSSCQSFSVCRFEDSNLFPEVAVGMKWVTLGKWCSLKTPVSLITVVCSLQDTIIFPLQHSKARLGPGLMTVVPALSRLRQ